MRDLLAGTYDGADLPIQVDDALTDQQIVDAAARAFAAELGVRAPVSVNVTGTNASRRLRILDLHAASLVAILHAAGRDSARAASVDLERVLEVLLEHEQRYWISAAAAERLEDLGVGDLHDVVAATYLLPPADEREAEQLLRRLGDHLAGPAVVRWLRGLYPPREGRYETFGGCSQTDWPNCTCWAACTHTPGSHTEKYLHSG